MIITNVESLRTWLVDALHPICDADPSTLAKYVLALVKKDKPVDELKDLCVDQLAVFLGEETLPFVSTLFEALESQSYLQNEKPLMSQKSEDIPDDDRDFRRRGKRSPDDTEEDEVKEESIRESRHASLSAHRFENNRRKQVTDGRTGSRRRNHHDHVQAKETDTKHEESDEEQVADHQNRHLQIEKSTRGISPHRRSPIRHISPPGHRRRYNHKPPVKIDRDHRRSRREDNDYRPSRHKSGSRSREEEKLHELAKENMINGPMLHFNPLPGLPPTFALPHVPSDHPLFPGNMIPFSKGMNVPLPPGPHTTQSTGLTMVPGQAHPIPAPFEVNPPRFPFFPMPPRPLPPGMMWNNHRGKFPGPVEPYNPEFPSIEASNVNRTGAPRNRAPAEINRERELVQLTQNTVNVSTANMVEQASSQKEEKQEKVSTADERVPVSSAADTIDPPSVPEPPRKPFQNQTILELKKIPEHFNDIMTLGQYFQRFGKVVNIKVRHDNDPQGALVEFASNPEARMAYSCPDAVLGNRFIKMFWHTVPQNKQRDASANKAGVIGQGRKTFPKEMTYINPDISSEQNHAHDEKNHNQDHDVSHADALNKEKESKMQEITKQKVELQKQRQVLLDKNIKEQKHVIDLLSTKKQMSAQDKQTLFKTLKLLEVKGEKLKREIEKVAKEVQANPFSKKALQKEILDSELEILNQKHIGSDTSTLKLKLVELKKKALSYGVLGSARGGGRGATQRGRGRGRGAGTWQRGQQNSSTSLDNRSRQFFVWGFDDSEKNDLLARCELHGKMERADEKLPGKLLISFETRKQAESAARDLASFYGKKLTLAWYEGSVNKRESSTDVDQHVAPPVKLRRRLSNSSDISMISLIGEEDKLLEFDENEKLLLGNEEDDDSKDSETKDGAWKR